MANENKKRILITGGAGFIGSHLCSLLVKDNFVYCLDNFYSGKMENISHLIENPNFELIETDIENETEII